MQVLDSVGTMVTRHARAAHTFHLRSLERIMHKAIYDKCKPNGSPRLMFTKFQKKFGRVQIHWSLRRTIGWRVWNEGATRHD